MAHLDLWLLIGRRCGGSLVWRCGGSLVLDVVAHWLKMWWLNGWRCGGSYVLRCGGSLVEDVVALWWRRCGSVVGNKVAHCLEIKWLGIAHKTLNQIRHL